MFSLFSSRTVALTVFGWPIHWYGLLYLASFIIAWFLLPRLGRLRGLMLERKAWEDILVACVLGVIVGGRLGFVFFYEPAYFLNHPFQIFALWQGGMASHGGFIGVVIALWILLSKYPWDVRWRIADVVSIPAAIGLGLGRIGNFINQELYGTVTSLPWGMSFPGAEGLRHPIQLYDAVVMMGIGMGIGMWSSRRLEMRGQRLVPGKMFAVFLILYGVARMLLEVIREQTVPPISFLTMHITYGQLLTIPIIVAGVLLFFFLPQRKHGG